MKSKSIIIRVTPEQHKQVKMVATQEGTTISKLLIELIELYITNEYSGGAK